MPARSSWAVIPFQVERFHSLAMVVQDPSGGLGLLGRDNTAGHGVGDSGQCLYQIGGPDDRRQIEPNGPAAGRVGSTRSRSPVLASVSSRPCMLHRSGQGSSERWLGRVLLQAGLPYAHQGAT